MGKCGEQTRAADQPDIPNDLSRPSKEPQNKDKNIVVLLPDGGDRYLSTALYE